MSLVYIHSLEDRVAYLELKLREHGIDYEDGATPVQETLLPTQHTPRLPESVVNERNGDFNTPTGGHAEINASSMVITQPIIPEIQVGAEHEASFTHILMRELMSSRLAPQLHRSRASGPGHQRQRNSSNIAGDLDTSPLSLPTSQIAENLVKEYFQSTSAGMPLLHEPTFRKKLDLIYNMPRVVDMAKDHKTTESRLALFFVLEVFAAALLSMSKNDPARIPIWLADRYHKTAIAALIEAGLPADVEGVQSLLLVGQFYYLHPTLWVVWNTVGAAIRLAVELGLHQDPSPEEVDALTLDTRRRTFWVAYAMDRNISVALNMPSCLSDGAISVEFPSDVNDELINIDGIRQGEAHKSGAKLVSLHLFRYRQIQSEMQQVLYEKPSSPYSPVPMDDWQPKMRDRIDEWLRNIPAGDNLNSLDKTVVETFELTHHTALFRLYRPSPNNPNPSGTQLLAATQSATKMIHLYREFFRRKRLTIYWQSVENVFSAGTTLLFAYTNSAEVREAISSQSFQSLVNTCSSVLWGMVEHFPAFQGKRDAFDTASSRVMMELSHEVSSGESGLVAPSSAIGTAQEVQETQLALSGTIDSTNFDIQPSSTSLLDFDDLSMIWEATADLSGTFMPSWV
ncbi:fungal specific transcription factor domain-containing protein [Colletotrichum asianum]|uniref:Fungal specific transcription factor domain-containing protein n=1 Tax=Colletotrichum asianum TaxID=702518 RepID=A0A8H3ZTQ2_9PEZI|nr:fungal specific transcription factor domain-containing protein [Colletotrichum asianum]